MELEHLSPDKMIGSACPNRIVGGVILKMGKDARSSTVIMLRLGSSIKKETGKAAAMATMTLKEPRKEDDEVNL